MQAAGATVVLEATGQYERGLAAFLAAHRVPFAIVNPRQVRAVGIGASSHSRRSRRRPHRARHGGLCGHPRHAAPNPLQAYHHALRARGQAPKVALVATMRKLLTVLNAVLHQQRPWRANLCPPTA